jgi:hypothetical protein
LKVIDGIKKLNVQGNERSQVVQLIDFLPKFIRPAVSSYLEKEKDKLTYISILIGIAQRMNKSLEENCVVGLAYAATIFGGTIWENLPKIFEELEEEKSKSVQDKFFAILSSQFGTVLTNWICTNRMCVFTD